MTQLTVTDLENAKQDVDTIAGIANSTEESITDRNGQTRRTIYSLQNEYPNASDNAAAALASATSASTSATIASSAQLAAEAARDAAILNDKVYATTSAGIAATTNGQYFSVPSADADGYLDLYLNNSGVADIVKTYPSKTAVDTVLGRLNVSVNTTGLSVTDSGGFALLSIDSNGIIKTPIGTFNTSGYTGTGAYSANSSGLSFDATNGLRLVTGSDGFSIVDKYGFAALTINSNGLTTIYSNSTGGGGTSDALWSDADIEAKNNAAISHGITVQNQSNPLTPIPNTDWVVFVMYGQSLSSGWEGWPALSKTAKYGNKMLGASVRPNNLTSSTFTPVTSTALYDLIATNQNTSFALLSDAETAALTAGNAAHGETPLEGWVNGAKRLYVLNGGDTSKVFIGINCGVGGQTITSLSKGGSYYGRITSALTTLKTLADASSKTLSVVSVGYLQGEHDYSDDTTKSAYKTLMNQLIADITADSKSITGQTENPFFMTYQTGGSYAKDTLDLAIANAQLELSNENTNYVLATPVYQMPDKGGHLDPNGYRWTGCQFAKVWEKVVLKRQGFKPIQPLTAEIKDNEILVNFHVPSPPLQWGLPYVGVSLTPTDYATKGFHVLDASNNPQPIISVSLVADCVVKIVLASIPTSAVRLFYARKSLMDGNGNLQDSDTSIADDNYVYNSGTGQYADANIPALLNKPYPLQNWCVAFVKSITEV